MEVRVLTPDDAPAYYALRLEGLETEPRSFGMAPEEFRATTVEQMATRLRDMPPHNFYIGAFDDGELVGIATFIRNEHVKDRHKGHVYGVYVARTHRRRGVARAMMASLLDRAKQDATLEQVLLAAAVGQDAAIGLYRSFGFESYGTEPRALKIGPDYVDDLLMKLFVR